MISELLISDPRKLPSISSEKNDRFPNIQYIKFDSGLNILFGPLLYDSAKILQLLARLTHCESDGYSKISYHSVDRFRGQVSHGSLYMDGAKIICDGLPTVYLANSYSDGFYQSATSYKKTMKSVVGTDNKMQALFIANKQLDSMESDIEIPSHMRNAAINKVALDHLIFPALDPIKKTLLIEDPTKNLTIPQAVVVWMALCKLANKYQIIVACNSIYCLAIKAKIIEIIPGYVDVCKKILDLKLTQSCIRKVVAKNAKQATTTK